MNPKIATIIGLSLAILISALSPILASSNPDGLERTAEKFAEAAGKEFQFISSPFPDYVIPILGETRISGALAVSLGTLIVFCTGYFLTIILKKAR
jgi:cobalt/nickel transport protein